MFEKFGKKISKVGDNVITNSKKFAEITTLNSKIKQENRQIDDYYLKIGKEYYQKYREECEEKFEEFSSIIQNSLQNISQCKKTIIKLKGVKNCSNCGAEMEQTSFFCSVCGNKMEVEEESVENFCPECKFTLSDDSVFCPKCGTKIGS